MGSNINILCRRAEPQDKAACIELGKRAHQEGSFKDLSFSVEKCSELFNNAIAHDMACLFVVEAQGRVVGFFVGLCSEHFFTKDLVSNDLVFYVAPEFRGSLGGKLMLMEFKDWSEKAGAKKSFVSNTLGISEAADKILTELGFSLAGVEYCISYGL